jgi:hypothetical protein
LATSVWHGYITLGLVSIPVKLFRAARPERVKLREVYTAPAQAESGRQGGQQTGPIPVVSSRKLPLLREAAPERDEQLVAVAPVRRVATNEAGGEIPQSEVGKGYEVAMPTGSNWKS